MIRLTRIKEILAFAVVLIIAASAVYGQTAWQATLYSQGQIIDGAVYQSNVVIGVAASESTMASPPAPPEYTVFTELWRLDWSGPYYQDTRQAGPTNYEWLLEINPHGNVPPPPARCATISWDPAAFDQVGQYSLKDTTGAILVGDMRTTTQYQLCGPNESEYLIVSFCASDIPVANFAGSPTSGYAPLNVLFTDSTLNSPTGWIWDFGDGGNSDLQNPSHTFLNPATYTVKLTATSACGSDTLERINYITVETMPSGCNYTPGDINGNGSVNGVDIVFAVNYFKGGPNHPPIDCYPGCPNEPNPFYAAGDVNGNCAFNGIDITFYVRYLKLQVPTLLYCVDCQPASLALPTPLVQPMRAPLLKVEGNTNSLN